MVFDKTLVVTAQLMDTDPRTGLMLIKLGLFCLENVFRLLRKQKLQKL